MTAAVAELDPVTEILRSRSNPLYFVWNYCTVRDEKTKRRVPFRMWPEQSATLKTLWQSRFVILLKARQIGMTTLVVCYAVWLALFHPGSVVLIFSKSQKEAKDVLKRIRQTIRGLPVWMQPGEFVVDATQELELSNGSRFITFASRGPGGDSYTASLVIVDEADLIPNLNELLEGAEPTIAADGRLILLSRANKKDPNSPFKRMYRAARDGLNEYVARFIPWSAAPWRTKEWYDAQRRKIESRTGALDDLYAQYPATDEESLAPRELDRRFRAAILVKCFAKAEPLPLSLTPWPAVEGLRVFERPKPGFYYAIGADVALGNPNSDDSVACVVERASQREVAILQGKYEPGDLAKWIARLAQWYNRASVLVERNHHGEHCISSLLHMPPSVAPRPRLLVGRDNHYGWWTDYQGKRRMYAQLADSVMCGSCTIVDQATYDQLISLDAEKLEAPEGQHDDCAVAFAIAIYACSTPVRKPELTVLTYDRQAKPEQEAPAPRPPDETIGEVEIRFVDNTGEWWAIAHRDGERLDLLGSADRKQAEAAGEAYRRLTGGGEGPTDDPIEREVWARITERGWMT
jgi:hypothetical protein